MHIQPEEERQETAQFAEILIYGRAEKSETGSS